MELRDCDVGGAELWGQALRGDEQSGGKPEVHVPASPLYSPFTPSLNPLTALPASIFYFFFLTHNSPALLSPLVPLPYTVLSTAGQGGLEALLQSDLVGTDLSLGPPG